MRIKEVGYIVERLADRFRDLGGQMAGQEAAHKAALTEIRASFNARTSADEKIIEGLRAEIIRVNEAHGRTKVENDGLLDELAAQRDAFTAEVAALKSQTPKHPVKVGEWVRRLIPSPACDVGTVAKVVHVDDDTSEIEYDVKRIDGQHGVWFAKNCEPCDPPEATHDTDAGKASAESAVRTEPVPEEIKVDDLVEVVSNTGGNTWLADVGSFGTVTSIETIKDSLSVRLKNVPDKMNVCGGYVSICDVRKVTT